MLDLGEAIVGSLIRANLVASLLNPIEGEVHSLL